MIAIEHKERLIRVDVFGEFTLADYREFERLATDTAQRVGKVDLMLNLLQMRGFTLDLAWEEIRFARTHPDDFERIAVVTDDQWVTWSAWISQAFVNADVQVFGDEAAALQWTEQGDPDASS
jgi:hypothetical protein